MSFNTEDKGLPVAFLKYSPHSKKNKIISLDEENKKSLDPEEITHDHLELLYGKEKIKRRKAEERMKQELIKELREHSILKDEFRVKDKEGKLYPIPDINKERTVWFLSGQSGSGKSYLSAELLNYYRKAGIKKIFIFTLKPDPKFGKAIYLNIDNIVKPTSNRQYQKSMDDYKKAKMKFRYKKKEMMEEGADLDDIIDLELEIENMKPSKEKKIESYEIKDIKKFEKDIHDSVFLFDDYESIPKD